MTAHQRKILPEDSHKEKIVEPCRLTEVFAVMSGLTQAGYSAIKKNLPEFNRLEVLGYQAAITSYDCKEKINQAYLGHGAFNEGMYDRAVKKAFDFVASALHTLETCPELVLKSTKGTTGGTTKDVILHIQSILDREASAARSSKKYHFMAGVEGCAKQFDVTYLAKPEKVKSAEKPTRAHGPGRKRGLHI